MYLMKKFRNIKKKNSKEDNILRFSVSKLDCGKRNGMISYSILFVFL